MPEFITLSRFNARERKYHIYKLHSSLAAEQPHYHDYYQVCFVFHGEVLHRQEGETIPLRRGDAFIIPPCFLHAIHFANESSEIYSLSFSESLFHAGFSQSQIYGFLTSLNEAIAGKDRSFIRMRVVLSAAQQQNIQALLDCLIREQCSDAPAGFSAAPSLVAAILYTLAQSYYGSAGEPRQKELSCYEDDLAACTEYIDTHYAEPLGIDSLCRKFAMSRSKFCMMFPRFTGVSLKQYVRNKRMIAAETLIRSRPELTLGEIAAAVGYGEFSTFYRNFVRFAGIPPAKYRESIDSES